MSRVPDTRVERVNAAQVRSDGEFVLYWMIANRRTTWNFALQRAVELCVELDRPLLVFEGLRLDYRWASQRLHTFIAEGMADNAAALKRAGVTYLPWMETRRGEGPGLLEALASHACAIVTDEFPCFFLPRMVAAAGRKLDVQLEAVDSNGVMPLRASPRLFTTAASFRRHVQKTVWPHLSEFPAADPLAIPVVRGAEIPSEVRGRWPATELTNVRDLVRALPVPATPEAVSTTGGSKAAAHALDRLLDDRLNRYHEDRNDVENGAASGLSPYLHFGHVSAHEIAQRIFDREAFTPGSEPPRATGSRAGWWGMSEPGEAFLDQLITWRELGYNRTFVDPTGFDRYETLPDWARKTLADHADDPREHLYSLEQLDGSETHDDIWNAAQRQLRSEGTMHNYLRMLWGKKVLEWSPDPMTALETLIELNNRYAIDGRNPNSYSGIFWTLGRFDRAWGPERPIFGKVRFMSSESTRRKLRLREYLVRYGE